MQPSSRSASVAFLKIIPAEYKIADEIKKSPKGFTTTIERVAGSKAQKVKILDDETEESKEKKQQSQPKAKKSLDDLLETGMV